MLFKASAPGSLMLLGEYAVLHDKPALVCAVDKRINVVITPRSDQRIIITTEGYATWETNLAELKPAAPFHFVSACLYHYQKKLPSGCEVNISSEFSAQMGLGSSAAVTVASLAALRAWLQLACSPLMLIREARQVIRTVQGVGSGADAAAAVLGGIVIYQSKPLRAEKLPMSLPLTVLYSGAKTPTVDAIQRVQAYFAHLPVLFSKLCSAIESCVEEGIAAIQQKDWARLGKVMNAQQGLMQALGVSTPVLDQLLAQLQSIPAILGAKISGAGLGDCVIGLGEARFPHLEQLEVKMTQEGVVE